MIFGDRVGVGADRAGARRAAQRAHAAHHPLRLLAGQQRHERLFGHDQACCRGRSPRAPGEVQRHDRDRSRRRCSARRRARSSSTAGTRGCSRRARCGCSAGATAPAAAASDPTGPSRRAARRPAPWRASALRRAARRRTPRRSRRPGARRAAPWSSAARSSAACPTANGCVPVGDRFLVGVHDQPRADSRAYQSRNSIISRNL